MEILFSAQYAPFVAAILAVVILGVLELLGFLLLGAGISDLAELMVQTDTFPDTAVTNWVMVKGLPLSIAVVLFLTAFGTAGLGLQATAGYWLNQDLPIFVAVIASTVIGFICLRTGGRVLAPIFADKTTAVSAKALVGLKTRVLSPRCTLDMPAEGSVQDLHGYTHQVVIVPADEEGPIVEDDMVVLVEHLDLNRYAVRKA